MLKIYCQQYNIRYKKHSGNKTNKTWKKSGTTYCLGCKDHTNNFKTQEVKLTNEVLREKSNYVDCWYKKPRFLR